MENLTILKVMQVLLKGDDLEKVNNIQGRFEYPYDDCWTDSGTFQEKPELQKFIDYPAIKKAFEVGALDYVAFRLDY